MFVRNSEFWRDLGSRFQELGDPLGMLRADWECIVGSGGLRDWRLCGVDSQSIRVRFEALARQAGSTLGHDGTRDPIIVWLDVLKDKSGRFHYGPHGRREDGTAGSVT